MDIHSESEKAMKRVVVYDDFDDDDDDHKHVVHPPPSPLLPMNDEMMLGKIRAYEMEEILPPEEDEEAQEALDGEKQGHDKELDRCKTKTTLKRLSQSSNGYISKVDAFLNDEEICNGATGKNDIATNATTAPPLIRMEQRPGAYAIAGYKASRSSVWRDDGDNNDESYTVSYGEDEQQRQQQQLGEDDRGLSIAVPVLGEESLPKAVEQPVWYKHRRVQLYGLFCMVLFVGGLILILLVTLLGLRLANKFDPDLQINLYGKDAHTMAPTTYREFEIQEQILLLGVSNEDLADSTSPYYHALQWITHGDPYQLNVTDPALMQRYLLGALYYETTEIGQQPWTICNPPTEAEDETCFSLTNNVPSARWLTGTNHCSWKGVTCNDMNETQGVNLAHQGIQSLLPRTIIHFPFLTSISLNDNDIIGTLLKEYASLRHLQDLDLSDNRITGSIPDTWCCSFDNIQFLSLSSNQLTGTIPNHWWTEFHNLMRLSIYGNYLSGTVPFKVTNLKNLIHLRIHENLFSGTIPTALGQLPRLWELEFGSNLFTGTLPTEIGYLGRLARLTLSRMGDVRGPIPTEIGLLTSLIQLHMQSMSLEGELPEGLWQLTKLTTIHLSNTYLSGTISTEIGQLTRLTHLQLNNNKLIGTIPSTLGLLTDLDQAYLQGNHLTGSVPLEVCNRRVVYERYGLSRLEVDCAPSESTGLPAIQCMTGCCTTCCDTDTGECSV